MANVYKTEKVIRIPEKDLVVVTGSVDDIPVEVSMWLSHIHPMSDQDKVMYVAGLMYKAAYPEPQDDLTADYPSELVL
jgi:hypothetical protein